MTPLESEVTFLTQCKKKEKNPTGFAIGIKMHCFWYILSVAAALSQPKGHETEADCFSVNT